MDDFPTAAVYEVTRDEVVKINERFQHELEYAEKADEHVWIVITSHRISKDMAKKIATEVQADEPFLDRENIVNISVGCYRCELALDPRLVDRRCKGEPKRDRRGTHP
jgi:hypothetical protein